MTDQLPAPESGIAGTEEVAQAELEFGNEQDRKFQRRLGWPTLAAMTFSGMVGSGWLFASFYAAKDAGPMSLVAWCIAMVATVLVGITFVELGVTRPIAGGNVRWPSVLSGPAVGVMIGWVVFLQTAVGTPSEASGLLQYASYWWPALIGKSGLTGLGLVIATLVLLVFAAINYFGVVLLATVNNLITIFKVVVPFLTVILLLATGFDSSNIATGGGWGAMGTGSMLTAITAAGMIYAFGGIQTSSIMAGETRNPRRDVPLGTFIGLGLAFVLYMLLQTSFIGAVPHDMLASVGWHGLNFDSPFADIAVLLNLGWLSTLLLVDSVVSPGGAMFLGTGTAARNTYGLGQNHTFPDWAAKVHPKYGIPAIALGINTAVSILFLFIFQSWQGLVQALGMFFAVGYAVIAVAAGVSRFDPRLKVKPWAKGLSWIAPASFVLSGLIMFWAGWSEVRMAVLLFLISVPIYAFQMTRHKDLMPARSIKVGLWFLVFMLVIGLLSWVGSFGGGANWIHAPYDSILVGIVSLAVYFWGRQSSLAWLRSEEAADTAHRY
jgi:amino acid transporter